jgi:tripartite ATP-independent transporter DctM subunit
MTSATMSALMILFLVIGIASGLPIAWALGGVAIVSTLLFLKGNFLFAIVNTSLGMMNNWVLVAVPLFIFMAMVLDKSEIIADLFEAAYKWSGGLRGGLAAGAVVVGTVFAACTGITAAAIVTLGVIALPIMLKHNYSKDIALGSILSGGTLGQLIPPSVMILLYGSVTQVSIGAMFAGGIASGVILSGMYVAYILIRSYIDPGLCPALPPQERVPWRARLASTKALVLPVVLIVAVLGSIFSGAATPTEASAVGALGALACAAIRRKLTWQALTSSCLSTLKLCGMVAWIVLAGIYFSTVFNAIGGADLVKGILALVPGGGFGALVLMLLVLFLLGTLVDVSAVVIIAGPIFGPIAASLGFDPVWFGVLFMVLLQMGYISPPFGMSLFYLEGVAPRPMVTMGDIYRSSGAFLGLQVVALGLFTVFPQTILWLPRLFFGG